MTNSPASPVSPPRFSAAVARGLREGAAISLGVIALVVIVALFSFDPRDPGFSSTGVGDVIHNRVGSTGAFFADLLYFLFGRPAYLLPLALGVTAARMARVRAAGRSQLARQFCGSRARLCPAADEQLLADGLALEPGRTAGRAPAASWVRRWARDCPNGMNLLGATLLLLAAWAASAAVAFGISWLRVIDGLGAAVWRGIKYLRERRHVTREVSDGRERKQARMDAGEAETKKLRARPPPRIEAPAPAVTKSERAEKERQVPLFDPPAGRRVAGAGAAG